MNQKKPSTNGKIDDKTRVQQGVKSFAKPVSTTRKKKARKLSVFRMVIINILKAMVVAFCFCLIVGSVVAVQVVQYIVSETNNDDNIINIDNLKLNERSTIMIRKEGTEDEWLNYQDLIGDENRVWVDYTEIPQDLVNAVVSTEDREFWTHHGVSFKRTILAALNEVVEFEDKTFGASTIHQQLIKNITGDKVVKSKDGDKMEGYKRKMREIFRAWGLANNTSKQQVMEAYLNTMGLSEKIAGVQAGAEEYFGKKVKDLTLPECALIAGITQSPSKHSPYQNPDQALIRRNDVLTFMRQTNSIDEKQYRDALATPMDVKPRTEKVRESDKAIFTYDVDMVFNAVVRDMIKQKGMTKEEAEKNIRNGGYKIYSTIDPKVQNALTEMYANGYEEGGYFTDRSKFGNMTTTLKGTEKVLDAAGNVLSTKEVMPQSAACVINYKGELVGIVGGIGQKAESLSLNRAWGTVTIDEQGNEKVEGTVRQVGSTMKPIAAYALGLEQGIVTYSTAIQDSPLKAKKPGGALDWPRNYNRSYRNVPVPVVSAIAESTNTIAAKVGSYVGVEEMFEFLQDTLKISSLVPQDMELAPLALGAQTYGISVYELAAAYAMFGGNDTYGVYTEPHCYFRVEDSSGNVVLEPEYYPVQAVSPETGYIMNRLLRTVVAGRGLPLGVAPTASGMAPAGEMDSVAKTGTTNDDKDRWIVGLTPYYVTAVWWGYDNPLQNNLSRWSPSARTNLTANVWKDLMETVQADLEIKQFPDQPENIKEAAFCSLTGDLRGSGCPSGGILGIYDTTKMPSVCKARHIAPEPEPPPA